MAAKLSSLPLEQIRARYRRRLIVHLCLTAAWLAYAFWIPSCGRIAMPRLPFYLFGGLAVYGLVAYLNWRCPSCGGSFGSAFWRRECPHCGVEFAEPKDPQAAA